MAHKRKLPRPKALEVEQVKVVDYLLNLEHKDGKSKAKYFLKRGFSPTDWKVMAKALKQHGMTQPVTETSESRHGRKFTVECTIETSDGKNPCILTCWIVEGTKPLRLVTAHPNS